MKKSIVFTVLLVLTTFVNVTAQSDEKKKNAPVEHRDVPAFNGIDVSDGIQLYITQGKGFEVKVSASEADYRSKIKTVVHEATLKVYIDYADDPHWQGLVNSKEKFKVYVSVENLKQLAASKGASVVFENTYQNEERLTVQLASGANSAGEVKVKSMRIELRGGAWAMLSGQAEAIEVRAIEGSHFESRHLKVNECKAFASSGSNVEIHVEEKLEAEAVNMAKIKYTGKGKMLMGAKESGGQIIQR